MFACALYSGRVRVLVPLTMTVGAHMSVCEGREEQLNAPDGT